MTATKTTATVQNAEDFVQRELTKDITHVEHLHGKSIIYNHEHVFFLLLESFDLLDKVSRMHSRHRRHQHHHQHYEIYSYSILRDSI